MVTTTRISDNKCPNCNACLDANTSATGQQPSPNDLSLCVYCQTLLVYSQDMKLRLPTTEEVAEYKADAALWSMIKDYRIIAREIYEKIAAKNN